MTIYVDFRAQLLANAGVAALVGNRVYPVTLPQQRRNKPDSIKLPAIVINMINRDILRSTGGQSTNEDVLLQVDIFANSYQECLDVGEACRNALNGNQDPFRSCFIQSQRDGFDAPRAATDKARFRIFQEWRVHAAIAQPA